MKQSLGTENHDQILKDIEGLSLEKYVDELAGAAIEGIARCKTEKDVWSAVEVRALLSRTRLVRLKSLMSFHCYPKDYIRSTPSFSQSVHPCPHSLAICRTITPFALCAFRDGS